MADEIAFKDWIKQRVKAVNGKYTAFHAWAELVGHDQVVDQYTPVQVSCPWHGPDNRPSARYYPAEGGKPDYVRCYKCKENWNSVAIFGKAKSLEFINALKELERRFDIKIPRKPENVEFEESKKDKTSSDFKSEAWDDLPRLISLLENKLIRLRDKIGLVDYVKFCRVLDAVEWDHSKQNQTTPEMFIILDKLRTLMDESFRICELNDLL